MHWCVCAHVHSANLEVCVLDQLVQVARKELEHQALMIAVLKVVLQLHCTSATAITRGHAQTYGSVAGWHAKACGRWHASQAYGS